MRKEKVGMENKKFKEGTVIKGRDLEGYMLCKVLSGDMAMQWFQTRTGTDRNTGRPAVKSGRGEGVQFFPAEDICSHLYEGTVLAVVSVPGEENVYAGPRGFRADRLDVRGLMLLGSPKIWGCLAANGADITAEDSCAVKWAAEEGHLEALKYLHANGADITAGNNYAVIHAAWKGHLEIVEYLHRNGADITADNSRAVGWAAEEGHLEVVKYLHANGADITARNNYAVRWAAENGHLEVVKYLYENGADITADGSNTVRLAEGNGHKDVVSYLKAHLQ